MLDNNSLKHIARFIQKIATNTVGFYGFHEHDHSRWIESTGTLCMLISTGHVYQ
jgi:hypothetical protein